MSYFTNFQDTLFSTAELSKGEKEKIDIFFRKDLHISKKGSIFALLLSG